MPTPGSSMSGGGSEVARIDGKAKDCSGVEDCEEDGNATPFEFSWAAGRH